MQAWWDNAKCQHTAAAHTVSASRSMTNNYDVDRRLIEAVKAASCFSASDCAKVTWRGHVTRTDSDTSYLRLHTWAAEDNGGVDWCDVAVNVIGTSLHVPAS